MGLVLVANMALTSNGQLPYIIVLHRRRAVPAHRDARVRRAGDLDPAPHRRPHDDLGDVPPRRDGVHRPRDGGRGCSPSGPPRTRSPVVTPETDYVPEAYRVADFSHTTAVSGAALKRPLSPSPMRRFIRTPIPTAKFVAGASIARVNAALTTIPLWLLEFLRHRSANSISTMSPQLRPSPYCLSLCSGGPSAAPPIPTERVRERPHIQVDGRSKGRTIYETLPVVPGFGLCILPPPSPGDVFLDFEGDPFVSGGGLEFLFGYALSDETGKVTYTGSFGHGLQ